MSVNWLVPRFQGLFDLMMKTDPKQCDVLY